MSYDLELALLEEIIGAPCANRNFGQGRDGCFFVWNPERRVDYRAETGYSRSWVIGTGINRFSWARSKTHWTLCLGVWDKQCREGTFGDVLQWLQDIPNIAKTYHLDKPWPAEWECESDYDPVG